MRGKKRLYMLLFLTLFMTAAMSAQPVSAYTVKYYAVIVGISDYDDSTGIEDLEYADDDANDWYNHLKYTEVFDSIRVLGDDTSYYRSYYARASEANIKSSLNWLVNTADSNDHIAVIFSGHGGRSSGQNGYYVAWDGNHLDDDELAGYLDDADASHIFVFIDACHSGCFLDDLDNMPNDDDVFATTSCRYDGICWEDGSLRNGIWTYYYLREYIYLKKKFLGVEPCQEIVYSGAYDDFLDHFDPDPLAKNRPQKFDGDPSHHFLLGPPES